MVVYIKIIGMVLKIKLSLNVLYVDTKKMQILMQVKIFQSLI